MKRKNRKQPWSIYLFALIFFLSLAAGLWFSGMDENIGQNPLFAINSDASKTVMAGKGYSSNQQLEEQLKEESRKTQVQDKISKQLEKEREKSQKADSKESKSSEETIFEEQVDEETSGEEIEEEEGKENLQDENTEEENTEDEILEDEEILPPEEDKSPRIITDLETIYEVEGTRLTFNLEAVDYKDRSIERGNFRVYVNDVIVYSSGTQYKAKYQPELEHGENKIVISVTDNYGNSISKIYKVNCNGDGQQEIGGSIRVIIDARTVGLGYLLDADQEFYKGDGISHVVMRALDANGFSYTARGNGSYGWYLADISKPGMLSEDDVNIPEPIQEKLDEEGASYMGFGSSDIDCLGEKSIYENSGWIYKYNDEFLDTGMSNRDAQDGDVIVLAFTLHMGNEYNGVWFNGEW